MVVVGRGFFQSNSDLTYDSLLWRPMSGLKSQAGCHTHSTFTWVVGMLTLVLKSLY